MGRIKANDGDEGENARMKYRILEGDGKDSLDIITDEITQEGIIVVKKVRDALGFLFYPVARSRFFQNVYKMFFPEFSISLNLL